MKTQNTLLLTFSCLVFVVGVAAVCQAPESSKGAAVAAPAATVPHAKPVNLKALPKDTSASDIDKLMHDYNDELSVPCGYCHEVNPQTKQIDYASDENSVKETARLMITMTADINSKYLGQLGDRRYADPITCGNCHQGQVQPPNFVPKPKR